MTRIINIKKFPCFLRMISCVFVSIVNFGGCIGLTTIEPAVQHHPPLCVEGSVWKYECNSCACIDGIPICTLIACPTVATTVQPQPQLCIEGTKWMSECNFCSCSNGLPLCTLQLCPPENPCELPIEPGPCVNCSTRFGYNQESGQCESFTYGGCYINANNFKEELECEILCEENPCMSPIDAGPCKACFSKYGYNQTSGQCEQFIYGGCEGNENKFSTQEECENRCEARCDGPFEPGTCSWNISRYFYNKTSGECEEFIYGGCGGNTNNFKTEEDCKAECKKQC